MQRVIDHYIMNPEDDEANFSMATSYENIGQTAAANSFYLRAGERTNNMLLRYECMIRSGLCFEKQTLRHLSVEGMYMHAINTIPNRPEGYYLLSRHYERRATLLGDVDDSIRPWIQSYNMACIGLSVAELSNPPLRTWVEYPGVYSLKLQKAISGWWTGAIRESKSILIELDQNTYMDEAHRIAVKNNMVRLGIK